MDFVSKTPVDPVRTSSPAQRMAASRQKLVAHMVKDEMPKAEAGGQHHAGAQKSLLKSPMVQKLMHAIQVWWRHHPAKLALEIAEPALHQYAKRKPFQLLGIAAAVGVATVFVRPWRLVSVTGLALAAFKSSGVANMAISMLSSRLRSQSSTGKANYQ